MAETQILGFQNQNAPNGRTTKGLERFELLAVEATFDGTAAGGSFVPAVQIVSDAGRIVGTFPLAASLSVGDSATITFAPFLRDGIGLTGIYYDRVNKGDWLEVITTDEGGDFGSGWGITLWAKNKGIVLDAGHGMSLFVDSGDTFFDLAGKWTANVTGIGLFTVDGGMQYVVGGDFAVTLSAGTKVNIFDHSSSPIFQVLDNRTIKGMSLDGVEFDINANAEFGVFVGAGGDVALAVANVELDVNEDTVKVQLDTAIPSSFQVAGSLIIFEVAQDGVTTLSLPTGTKFEVQDHNGNPIFRVNEDGSLQGKTGKALTFNL